MTASAFRVLIAGECSGLIRDEFLAFGYDAYSCDLKPSENGGPHIQADVRTVLSAGWGLLIGHPTCTFLAKSGDQWNFHPDDAHLPRKEDTRQAIEFFLLLKNAPIEYKALENPTPFNEVLEVIGEPTQKIQPYWFGDPFTKTSCLWLENLPPLQPEVVVAKGRKIRTPGGKVISEWYSKAKVSIKEKTQTDRSRTFPGVAKAMARQWDYYLRTGKIYGQLF